MQSMKSRLSDERLLAGPITSVQVDALLSTLQIHSATPMSGRTRWNVRAPCERRILPSHLSGVENGH